MPSPLPARSSLLVAFALGAIWLPVLYLLSPQWSIYEQYSYGWAVPFLCLFLAWQRWTNPFSHGTRAEESAIASISSSSAVVDSAKTSPSDLGPPPSDPLSVPTSDLRPLTSALPAPCAASFSSTRRMSEFQIFSLFAFLLLLLPLRILQEANPLWRLASYMLAGNAIALTLLLARFAGGMQAARAFAFAICFFLIAVPWPTLVETYVIQALTRFNTTVVTEIITGLGIPALASGNVIELSTGRLGVEEACSGIRSLQAVLMISLFFGELYRLCVRRRIGLIAAAFASAVGLNIVRTTILVWIAAHQDIAAANRWHDTTGVIVLVSCLLAVWLIARLLRVREPAVDPSQPATPLGMAPVRPSLLWITVGLSAFSVLGAEVWFRIHERSPAHESWRISLPKDRTRFREVPLNAEVRGKLQFDAADSAMWQNPDGTVWQLFHFRWNPATRLKDRVRVQLAKSHRPEICLPASGWQLKQESAPTLVEVSGESLLFRTYDFSTLGRTVFVFFCVREDGTPSTALGNMRETHLQRWRAAWQGNRGLGQRVIEIAISGPRNLTEARASLTRELPHLIHIDFH